MIYVIGIGVEGKASLTERAARLVDEAGLLVGGSRHLDEFPGAGGSKAAFKGLDDAASVMRGFLRKKKGHVAVLASGDPLLYGIGSFLLREFGKDIVEVLPNVSAVQEAFARIKEDMNGLKILSVHGRQADFNRLASEVFSTSKLALFTDRENDPGRLSRELLARGVPDLRAFVCSSLGTKKEKVFEGTLKKVAGRKSFDPLNVFIIMNGDGRLLDCGFGFRDDRFSHS
ncbi:partial cobalt-precorrin-7 (C5)-methyltransferase, partial [Planctomycetaceae bacterium]